MEILGQSQISIRINLCAHVIPTMQAEVAAQMDEILTPQPVATKVAATAESGAVN